jgi:hypothetical protein
VGASATLVAAVVGVQLAIYGVSWSIGLAAAGVLGVYQAIMEDSGAVTVVDRIRLRMITAAGIATIYQSPAFPFGLILPRGNGLKIVASAGNTGAVEIESTVYYATQ